MRLLVAGNGAQAATHALQADLETGGHAVQWQEGGNVAEVLSKEGTFDVLLLVLDPASRASPRGGLQLLPELRRQGCAAPILAVCGGDTATMLESLDCGADDFIVQPLRSGELQARLETALRHARRSSRIMMHGQVRLDRGARQVTLGGRPVALQSREFMLLEHLLEYRGRVLSRAQLQDSLYEEGSDIDSNAIEVHVHNLRRKLGKNLIRTVHGQGYVIDGAS
jgi:DNA-binding response OmpR family regulator